MSSNSSDSDSNSWSSSPSPPKRKRRLHEPDSSDESDDDSCAPEASQLALSSMPVNRNHITNESKYINLASRAMNNPLVIHKVSNALPPGTLLELRQSCTLWDSTFSPQLKQRHSAILLYTSSSSDEPHSLTNFVNLLQSNRNRGVLGLGRCPARDIPFTRYRIILDDEPESESGDTDSSFNECDSESDDSYSDYGPDRKFFWTLLTEFGNTITSLELKWFGAVILEVPELTRLIFDLTPNLKELSLDPSEYNKMELPMPVEIQHPPKFLLNLRRLKACIYPDSENRGMPPRTRPWDEEQSTLPFSKFTELMCQVVQAATALEALDLSELETRNEFVARILRELNGNPASSVHVDKLKSFKSCLLTDECIQKLIDLATSSSRPQRGTGNHSNNNSGGSHDPLQLESFDTELTCSTERRGAAEPDNYAAENSHLLHTFLSTQSATLKELTLRFRRRLPDPCRLPRMEQLKKLCLLGPCGLAPAEVEFQGTFADTFPQLRQFWYQYEVQDVAGGSSRDDDTAAAAEHLLDVVTRLFHPGVQDFKLEISRAAAYKNCHIFGPVFPSATRVDLSFGTAVPDDDTINPEEDDDILFDVRQLAKVWTTWSALSVLRITWNVDNLDIDLDAWLSGVPRPQLEILRCELVSEQLPSHDSDSDTTSSLAAIREMVKWKGRDSISDLEHLRELTISSCRFNRDDPKLTDLGVYFGLALAASSIQQLVVYGPGKNLVSKKCEMFLKATMGPTVFISL